MTGQTISHYRVLSKLGEGGMGIVYKAEDTKLRRTVALKFLPPHAEESGERFLREAQAAASLNHPNLCTIFEIDEEHGFIAMEFVEGPSVRDKIAARPLPLDEALDIAIQACTGLQAAHEKGIVHRDIKPANLMLTAQGKVKIMDFGLAQMDDRTRLTKSGASLGTPAYMSPEQAQGQPTDRRTDLWSIGVVLHEMLAGTVPFAGQSEAACTYSIVHTEPEPLTALRSGLPVDLDRIIAKALRKDPRDRYQNAEDLMVDLRHLSGRPVAATGSKGALEAKSASEAKSGWKVIVPAAAAVLALFAAGYFYFQRTPKLTDQDTIVLADFTNTTGDPVFDGTLRQGLAIQLEQSPFLRIMDDVQVQRDLRLMSLAPGTRITRKVAHDICVRDGAAATIDGTIAGLGRSYVITLQAINCQSGATLAREQVQADNKELVLRSLGTAATAMRARLGESLSSIQKLSRPLEQATTSSLEALQNFTVGQAQLTQGHSLAAVPLLMRAIALDPNFAMAYNHLSIAFSNAGDTSREAEYKRKAFALIDRVSAYERDVIAGGYYRSTGELDKSSDAFRVGIGNYPSAWPFHNLLSENYINLGQFEEGLKEGHAAVQLQPNAEPPYRRLLDAYMCLDRLDEAKKVAERMRVQGIGGARVHQRFLEMAYMEGDQAAAAREIQWFAGKPEEYLSFGLQAANRNVLGRRLESSKLYKRAAETALRRGLQGVAAGFDEADASADALSGNCRTVRRLGRPPLALAMCGDTAQAEKLAAETSKRSPKGTLWNSVHLPEIRAAIELQRDQPAKAVELVATASPFERAYPEVAYLRGLAYLRLHKGAEAAAEFRKILNHKGASWASTWRSPNWGLYYAISYVGLARASALAGETANGRRAYQDFLALWKDADPDLPILQQAKAEYAKVQ